MQKILNTYLPVRDFLYILQLEEYELARYWKQIPPRLFKRNFEQRDTLKFSQRIKLILTVTLVFILFSTAYIFTYAFAAGLVMLVLIPFLTPYIVAVASLVVSPMAILLRKKMIRDAKNKFITQYPTTKIIGITGSYGKTTTKYLLKDLLEHTHIVSIVPNNINTTIGVAQHILKNTIPKNCEYLVVEMGAYTKGDIAEITNFLPPDICILTKLGDQHLERFGSFNNLVKAKYELFDGGAVGALKFTTNEAFELLAQIGLETDGITPIDTPNDSSSNVYVAKVVARNLGVTEAFIETAIHNFVPPERRNNIYVTDGVTIIDNSYNISPQTAESMLQEAQRTAKKSEKKLVVMSGGIAEQGEDEAEVNKEFGRLLNNYADKAILHPSIYLPYITSTLTIPFETAATNKMVINDINTHIKKDEEILLYLTGATDLSYI